MQQEERNVIDYGIQFVKLNKPEPGDIVNLKIDTSKHTPDVAFDILNVLSNNLVPGVILLATLDNGMELEVKRKDDR